jgi:hypothetical protein
MMPVGILLAVLGYAVTYSGVMTLTRGVPVGVIESLKPGFVPPPPAPKERDTGLGGFIKGVAKTAGGPAGSVVGNVLTGVIPGTKTTKK